MSKHITIRVTDGDRQKIKDIGKPITDIFRDALDKEQRKIKKNENILKNDKEFVREILK